MTACLHWNPDRERAVNLLAREIGDRVREHRQQTGLSQIDYARQHGLNKGRVNEVESVRKPNYTILTALQLLGLAGYTLRIVPVEPERAIPSHTSGSY